jgi:hypothetical protein
MIDTSIVLGKSFVYHRYVSIDRLYGALYRHVKLLQNSE